MSRPGGEHPAVGCGCFALPHTLPASVGARHGSGALGALLLSAYRHARVPLVPKPSSLCAGKVTPTASQLNTPTGLYLWWYVYSPAVYRSLRAAPAAHVARLQTVRRHRGGLLLRAPARLDKKEKYAAAGCLHCRLPGAPAHPPCTTNLPVCQWAHQPCLHQCGVPRYVVVCVHVSRWFQWLLDSRGRRSR